MGALQKLEEETAEGNVTDEAQVEYNKIDNNITESMLAADNQLPYQSREGFSRDLQEILCCIRYFWLLYR